MGTEDELDEDDDHFVASSNYIASDDKPFVAKESNFGT